MDHSEIINNRIVIYSNGIADFQRVFTVNPSETLPISIPVKQDHLADLIASFSVYGDVLLESPPTFQPTNALEGNLSIDTSNAIEDMARQLSGTRVKITVLGKKVSGTLVGLNQEPEGTPGHPIKPHSAVIYTKTGIERFRLRDIENLEFEDDEVNSEIEKALQRNYQKIKPNSSFVDLELKSTSENSQAAILQYTIPAAAWKISYRIQLNTEGESTIQGYAVIDNNTEEDWKDYQVCVVTGEPITFSTDLATSKIPSREHKDLVKGTAISPVDVESEYESMRLGGGVYAAGAADYDEDNVVDSKARYSKVQMRTLSHPSETRETIQKEVGEFSTFESKDPVTIPAKRSTSVPVFTKALSEISSLVHFKESNHAKNPYTSVEFNNETGFPLAKGVCTVFTEGAYSGSCVIPITSPAETQLLPHALETGIQLQISRQAAKTKCLSITLSKGFSVESKELRKSVRYHVDNQRNKDFKFVLDHEEIFKNQEFTAVLIQGTRKTALDFKRLSEGIRLSFNVIAHSNCIVEVEEKTVMDYKVELTNTNDSHNLFHNIEWFEQNLISTKNPLANSKSVSECIAKQNELQQLEIKIETANKEIESLDKQQKRLRENIKVGGQDRVTESWRNDLAKSEIEILRLEQDVIPLLHDDKEQKEQELRMTIMNLSEIWNTSEESD